MPITTIDPCSALVVIDIQKGILTQPTVHDSRAVIDNVATLAKTFREKRLPVVLVRVGWSADFGDTLKARVESPRPTGAVAADFMEYVDALDVDPARDI
ncbi:MAG: isochorismatase family protein, partial [Vulcanimicrobiaceae bacterium]